jgi:hypothetical protein
MGNRGDDVKAGVAVGTGVAVASGEFEGVRRGLAGIVVATHVGTNETLAPSVRQSVVATSAPPVVENVKESKWQFTNVIVDVPRKK